MTVSDFITAKRVYKYITNKKSRINKQTVISRTVISLITNIGSAITEFKTHNCIILR